MADRYTVVGTRADIQSVDGKPAERGVTITFDIYPYNERAEVFVADADKSSAKQRINDYINWRDNLEA